MSKDELPTWQECFLLLRKEEHEYDEETKKKPTELHRFIYEEEPADTTASIHFRERLLKLINYLTTNKK